MNRDELLEQFAGWFATHSCFWIGDEYDYATDSFIIVRKLWSKYQDWEISDWIKESVRSIRSKLKVWRWISRLRGSDLLRELTMLEQNGENLMERKKDEKCSECMWRWEVEWRYENWSREDDCPVCDWYGKIWSSEVEKVLKYDYASFQWVITEIGRWKKIATLGDTQLHRTDNEFIYGITSEWYEFILMPARDTTHCFRLKDNKVYTS